MSIYYHIALIWNAEYVVKSINSNSYFRNEHIIAEKTGLNREKPTTALKQVTQK